MIRTECASDYQRTIYPWVFDRIEVSARVFTGPAPGSYIRADFDRPSEPLRFSLLGSFHCEYETGPHLLELAHYCEDVTGTPGIFGFIGGRRGAPQCVSGASRAT